MTRKKKRKSKEFEDDGHTIADMSNVERPSIFFPHRKKDSNDSSKIELKGKNFWAFLAGASKATFLIAMVYVVVFGIVCLLFYLVFKNMMQ